MVVADFTVNFTVSNLVLVLVAGGVAGLVTGQLMKSKGVHVLGDLIFGVVGAVLGGLFLAPLFNIGRYGFTAYLLLAIAVAVVLDVLLHGAATARRKATA